MEPSPSPAPSGLTVDSEPFGVLIGILSIILMVIPVVGALGTAFLWRVYLSDTSRPRSWVLFLMSAGATAVSAVSIIIAFLAVRRFFGAEPLPQSLLLLAASVVILEVIPIWYAFTVYRVRRKAGKQPR